jgi:hypothetical protein
MLNKKELDMQDFEVLPIGTTQYIKDLELELSLLRKFEDKVTGDVVREVAIDIMWMGR